MIAEKNWAMLLLSAFMAMLSVMVHVLHRWAGFAFHNHGAAAHQAPAPGDLLANLLLAAPLLAVAISWLLYMGNRSHPLVPAFIMLSLTFGSISMIAGAGGMIEYHLSIFLAMALTKYYESIPLICLSAACFAIHHIAGDWWFPELVYGASYYAMDMVMLHLVFVGLFLGAATFQLVTRKRALQRLREQQKQELADTVERLVGRVSESSERILATSQQMLAQTEELTASSRGSAAAMGQIEGLASTHEEAAQETARAVQAVAGEVAAVAETTADMTSVADRMYEEARQGGVKVAQAVEQMGLVRNAAGESAVLSAELDVRFGEIEHIAGLITRIAHDTSLLALNAAIEAAHAGEHGRGFAVVAHEVRKLSESSKQSAEQIAASVKQIRDGSAASLRAMNNVMAEVAVGAEAVGEAGRAFEHITQYVGKVTERIHSISEAAMQISAGTEQMGASMEQFAGMSTVLKSNVATVAARTADQERLFGEAAELARVLEQLSSSLQTVMQDIEQSFVYQSQDSS